MNARKVKWRPSRRGGSLGEPVEFEMRADDYAEMRARGEAALALPPGVTRSQAIHEIRILWDLFALGGTSFERAPAVAAADLPRHAPRKQPPAPKEEPDLVSRF